MTDARLRFAWWGLLLAAFAIYAPSIANDFTHDDRLLARPIHDDGTPNAMSSELLGLGDYFGSNYWEGYKGRESHLYRPITILSYAVTNAACGGGEDALDSAWLHHLTNVLLHVWAVALVAAVMRTVTTDRGAALVAATVFAFHAIHSEAVAGVVGRAELFGFCFGACGLVWFVRAIDGARVALLGSAVMLFLAFGSKESALSWAAFVPLVAAVRALRDGRSPGATLRSLAVPTIVAVAVPAAAYLALRHQVMAKMPAEDFVNYLSNPLYFVDTGTRLWTAIGIWGFALFQCVAPFDLVSEYGPVTFPLVDSPWNVTTLGAGAVLIGWLVVGLATWRRHPLVFLGMACFFGFSFLTTNIPLAIGTVHGERLYYTPSLGIAMTAGWLWLVIPGTRTPMRIALGVWCLACALVILDRNGAWRDDETLLFTDLERNPQSIRLLNTAAGKLNARGEPDRAFALWERALELEPEYANGLSNYGAALGMRGEYQRAEPLLLAALEVPEHKVQRPEFAHANLAALYEVTQRPVKAWEHAVATWDLNPGYGDIHASILRLAEARLQRGWKKDTLRVLREMAEHADVAPDLRRRARQLVP